MYLIVFVLNIYCLACFDMAYTSQCPFTTGDREDCIDA